MKNSRVKSGVVLRLGLGGFYVSYGRFSVIGFKSVRSMDVPGRLPRVIAFRVTRPFYEILQGLVTPGVSVITDLLHFIFRLSVDKVRWWSGEVGAVCGSFAIG